MLQIINEERAVLENGGHVFLMCSSCGKGLVDILVTQPNAIDPKTNKVFEWKVRAKCCYCGDKSFIKTVKGKFHRQGYAKIKKDDCTDCIPETTIDDVVYEKDVVVFNTVKA